MATRIPRILVQRGDGIGSRLLTLLWTLRLARKADVGVVVFWPSLELFYQGTVAGDLFDLFRLALPPFQDRLQIIDGDCRQYFRPRKIFLDRNERYEPGDLVASIEAGPQRRELPVIDGGWEGPILTPGEDRDAVLAEMPALFAELPFREDLMGEVDRVASRVPLSEAVAVHVRRNELVGFLRDAVSGFRSGDESSERMLDRRAQTFVRRCMSVADFAGALRGFAEPGRQILLFTDDPTIGDGLAGALGASDIAPVAPLIKTGFTPIQLAFIEAVLMSRCACIVGGTSAYGEFAHVIGGAERIFLKWRQRSPEECAAFMLASVSDELGAHPEKLQIERRLREQVARLLPV